MLILTARDDPFIAAEPFESVRWGRMSRLGLCAMLATSASSAVTAPAVFAGLNGKSAIGSAIFSAAQEINDRSSPYATGRLRPEELAKQRALTYS